MKGKTYAFHKLFEKTVPSIIGVYPIGYLINYRNNIKMFHFSVICGEIWKFVICGEIFKYCLYLRITVSFNICADSNIAPPPL